MGYREKIKKMGKQARQELADKCKLKRIYLEHISRGTKHPSPLAALRIAANSGFQIELSELHPEFADELKRAGYVRVT